MLSRTLLRSLPRTTSRLASVSTRTSLRPAIQSILRQNVSRIPPSRAAFTTSSIKRDSIAQELSAKLTSEISLEQENDESTTDSNSNADTFLTQNDFWSVEDKEGSSEVIMTRKYDDETITVAFNIADMHTPPVESSYEEPDEALYDEEEEDIGSAQSGGGNTKGAVNQGRTEAGNIKVAPEDSVAPADREELRNEEDEYDQTQAFPANVNVLIQRPDKGSLRINLVAYNGTFTTHGVTHVPSSSSPAIEQLRELSSGTYTGPPFQQLDDELQDLLGQYLDARGINTALALFVPDYIDVKEQREYLGWLGRVKDFVE